MIFVWYSPMSHFLNPIQLEKCVNAGYIINKINAYVLLECFVKSARFCSAVTMTLLNAL